MNTKVVSNNDIYYPDKLWWFKQENEDSFSIFNLESLYDERYFRDEHMGPNIVNRMITMSESLYHQLTGRKLNSVLEVGCGGGWITKIFQEKGFDITGIEGSEWGYKKCLTQNLNSVIKHDLRLPIDLDRKFNLVISTEVAEHIEPPFVSTYIKNLVDHSDLIWFSYNSESAHSNHSNCMPEKYWRNIFAFYGYDYYKAPSQYKEQLNHRLDGIFYNSSVYDFNNVKL